MIRIAMLTASLFALVSALQADEFQVLQNVEGASPATMMPRYVLDKALKALDRREQRYEELQTREQLAAWQEQIRTYFVDALGGFPGRTPLNPQVVGTDERDGYRVERIIFESQPGLFVTANLATNRRSGGSGRGPEDLGNPPPGGLARMRARAGGDGRIARSVSAAEIDFAA